MKNLQITALSCQTLVHVHYCKRSARWYAKRSTDGAESPRYADLRDLADDLAEASEIEDFWQAKRDAMQRDPVDYISV